MPAQLSQLPKPARDAVVARFANADLPIYGVERWQVESMRDDLWMAHMTGREALEVAQQSAEAMALHLAGGLVDAARSCVAPGLLDAVLARPQLARRWPWLAEHRSPLVTKVIQAPSEIDRAMWAVFCLAHTLGPDMPGELGVYEWPSESGLSDVLEWLRKGGRIGKKVVDQFSETYALNDPATLTTARGAKWIGTIPLEDGTHLDFRCAAILHAAELAVERDRARPAIAIDAGKAHHALLSGMVELPKGKEAHRFTTTLEGRVELLAPGRRVQLGLDLSLAESLVHQITDWRSWMGLRNWLALLRLLSVEGGREGMVRWTLDAHLEALGFSAHHRTRTELRERIAEDVRFLTTLEIAAYGADGKVRERLPLFHVGSTTERREGSRWLTEATDLKINSLVYSGVRSEGGALGRNWHPAPVELAQTDHTRFPYALALGAILPIRWRWDHDEGRTTLNGANLLKLAGITYRKTHPGEAWDKLERNLTELRRIGGIGGWRWRDGSPSLAGMCELSPQLWMLDRTHHGVAPKELPPGPNVLTGAELRELRKLNNWTQGELAQRLGVSQATVSRAERKAGELLPADLVAQLRRLMG